MATRRTANSIPGGALGRLFKAFRDHEKPKKPLESVLDRFQKLVNRFKRFPAYQQAVRIMGTARRTQRNHFNDLEAGNFQGPVPLGAAYAIAHAYEIPFLMVDPLLSSPSNAERIVQDWRDGIDVIKIHMKGKDDGYNCRYRVPRERLLDNTETAFVELELGAQGYSTTHAHPGDELMLVMRGSVEIRLENCGLRTRLDQGDFIHFYAEQRHSARAISGKAKVFVIRFYQLKDGGTRRTIADGLDGLDKDLEAVLRHCSELNKLQTELDAWCRSLDEWSRSTGTTEAARHGVDNFSQLLQSLSPKARQALADLLKLLRGLPPHTWRELGELFSVLEHIADVHDKVIPRLRELTSNSSGAPRSLERILDPFGLSRFVKQTREAIGGRFYVQGLDKNTRVQLVRIRKGLPAGISSAKDLVSLARKVRMAPILFAAFLVPPIPNFVVVRKDDLLSVPRGKFDIPRGVSYRVPNRNLAGSDIAVTFLSLDPGKSCQWNWHPGLEAIIPLKGDCTISFRKPDSMPQAPKPMRCGVGQFAHYRSQTPHQVRNNGRIRAELLVIRFHQETSKAGPQGTEIPAKFLKDGTARALTRLHIRST